jgi:signal peptidase I
MSKEEKKEERKPKTMWQKVWHFLWYEDSVASWIVSILIAFVLIKFVIYPGLGLVMGTQFPVVAVVSESMEHNGSFDQWWSGTPAQPGQEDLYLEFNITKQEFQEFPLHNGFNKGDIIILVGTKPEDIKLGQVIVYWGGKQYPIIHRVVEIDHDQYGDLYFQTKGDHNRGQITPNLMNPYLNEKNVTTNQIVGRAVLRVPYLGWVKIGFVNLLNAIGIPAA